MRYTKVTSVQMSLAGYLLVMGALILVAPHQFDHPEYIVMHWALDAWGVGFLMLGAVTLSLALFHAPRWLQAIFHIFAGLVLFTLAAGFARTGFWHWATNYALLGCLSLGLAAIPPAARARQPEPAARSLDLLGLFLGLLTATDGLLFLFAPQSFFDARYDLLRRYLVPAGIIFLVTGLLLMEVELFSSRNRALEWAIYTLGGVVFLAYTALVPARHAIWPGALFYGGFGLLMLLQPVLRRHRAHLFDPSLLYTRLSLLLVAAVAIPLITTVTLISKIEEASVTREVLDRQRAEASILAQTTSHYIALHRSALRVLAGQVDLARMDTAALEVLLQRFGSAYPDVLAFSVFGSDGQPIARSDNAPAISLSSYAIFEDVSNTRQPGAVVYNSPIYNRPVFAFSEPLFDSGGAFRGMAMISMDSHNVSQFINDQGQGVPIVAYLVDEGGSTISHPQAALVQNFADLSAQPPVRAMLENSTVDGSLIYGPAHESVLAGFARVPVLGWGVVVERPAAAALAGVHSGRDIAFGILLLFLSVVVISGVFIAGWVSRPLEELGLAAVELASENNRVRVPKSSVTEIQRLADAFSEMRARLQQRTAERERAEQALRQANEQLEQRVEQRTIELQATAQALRSSNRELQDFAYITSHDLQEPLRKVQAFGDRLRKHSAGMLSPEGLDSLERMQNAAQRMQKMINDLLSYSRVTTHPRAPEAVDLNAIVREVVSDLEVRISQTGGSVENGPLPVIYTDPTHMRQLLQNLIGNGLKFHRPEVPPLIQIESENRLDGWLVVRVSDNGIGFENQYAERIFHPFQRLHSREAYEGNGIGLAICRKIVEQYGGAIYASSSPGQGACFTIEFPPQVSTHTYGV